MSKPVDFVSWVIDPRRTNDELFTVELLVERMRAWQHWPFRERAPEFPEKLDLMKQRRFNPAYRPSLALDELEALQARAETVTHFDASGGSDRTLRDLTALGFFPALKDIGITGVDLADLSPLAGAANLERLTLMEGPDSSHGHHYDFGQLGAKPVLLRVWLSLCQPWPDLAALAQWPALEDLHYHGNLLAFSEVATLPAVEFVQAQNWVGCSTPLRNLQVFPTMPKVKVLDLTPTASLEGIERFPTVLNLAVGGDFVDLTPLAAMENVTFLKLTSEYCHDLSPLTRMPKLRELIFVRERPLDLSPLTEAPHLRRVHFERCATMRTELAALNAGLLPEADDFLAETPRPLGPLPFYHIGNDNEAGRKYLAQRASQLTEMRDAYYAGDAALQRSEARTFLTELFAQLNRLLGRRWGVVETNFENKGGRTRLCFKRFADTSRIREIIQLLRELSARSRFPWTYDLQVEAHGDMSYEMEQLKELEKKAHEPEGHWLAKYFEPESVLRENEEGERQHREKFELLEREHLYHLQQQQGDAIDPDLAASFAEDDDEDEEGDELQGEDDEPFNSPADSEEDGEGGVALAPPPPAPPDTESLSDQLLYYVTLLEDGLYVNGAWAEQARYGLGESPIEWTEST